MTSLTYAFPTVPTDYSYSYETGAGFAPITAKMQTAALFAFDQVRKFTLLDLTAGDAVTADIRLAMSDRPTTAYAYMPGDYDQAGDIWFGRRFDYTNAESGNYAWHSIMHEIGHALGLEHGQDYLPADRDSIEYSIMTYRSYIGGPVGAYTYSTWSAPQTFMMMDIAALQNLYGADYTASAGNTVYRWSPDKGRIFETVWDGNGIDTYNLSAYQTGVRIDLRPGYASAFDSDQLAFLGNGHSASGNVYNALLHDDDDTRSLIENAVGGRGNDRFISNAADNTFTGGKGADVFVLINDGSHDTITDYVAGVDRIVYRDADWV